MIVSVTADKRSRGCRMRQRVLCVVALTALTVTLLAGPPVITLPRASASSAVGPLRFTRVYLDGQRVPLPVPAVVAGGKTLVPARGLFEHLGAEVIWDGVSRVTVKATGHTIDLWLGQPWASVDGRSVPLDTAPFLWRSRVMVPLRFVAENMGCRLTWDEGRFAVHLTRGGGDGGEAQPVLAPIREITLAFAGDTLLGYHIGDLIRTKGPDYPWAGISDVLGSADLAMVNLECSVSLRGSPMPDKKWTFRADPSSLGGLRRAGVDVVSVANNHSLDYGQEAFVDTLDYLAGEGVAYCGGGRNLDEALRPVILEVKGFKVGFLGATAIYPVSEWVASSSRPGILPTHYEAKVMAAVAALKKEVDFVVVAVHWGEEYKFYPNDYQRRYGRALVDAGADVVVGHHPHVLQGIEVYRGRVIAYSLGNFIFTYTSRPSQESGILLVTLDEQGLAAARFLPVFTNYGQPILESGEGYTRMLSDMNTWSSGWGTEIDPGGYVLVP
ncbi:MAG: CapA family protein [Firmicutes bacterium]|nr:CapA family protein [Bacillota bacterium]